MDTSVLGGVFDEEFAEPSIGMMNSIRKGKLIPLISDTLALEVAEAPIPIQDLLNEISELRVETIPISREAYELHNEYLRVGVVTPRFSDDALHVAQATIARADVIVSWNFRHLVNPVRIRAFNGVNLTCGYGMVIILTPADLTGMIEVEDE